MSAILLFLVLETISIKNMCMLYCWFLIVNDFAVIISSFHKCLITFDNLFFLQERGGGTFLKHGGPDKRDGV